MSRISYSLFCILSIVSIGACGSVEPKPDQRAARTEAQSPVQTVDPATAAPSEKQAGADVTTPSEKANRRIAEGVSKSGDNRYEVESWVVQSASDGDLMRQARFVPTLCEGENCGFKIFAIRNATLLSETGFQAGDRVYSINGRALSVSTIDAVIAKLQPFEIDSELKLAFVRKGEEMVTELVVVANK